ncbi:DsbA family protein [Acidicapsa acidisoli]|uniref:DsbA family protein n=1 Tax=Acidicapsa acidisoli TaxID=1615681 RepID=UPI0021DF51F7|nr:thioredoxin domain-containing protein [Acidicapsa acidisoli]
MNSSRATILAVLLSSLVAATPALSQFGGSPSGTQVHDTSALHPPAGAHVAIVEFEDQECPLCGHDNPVLKAAAAKYNIPWVRHDFPLKMHAWSFEAAVDARWFDTKSKKLGDEYRDAIFANQPSFYNDPTLVRKFTESFAQNHAIQLPFALDPQGNLAAGVTADYNLGVRTGIEHTPTIWIVTDHSRGAPFIEVTNIQNLYQIIDQALADTKGVK